jgi:hypothetical protein
MQSLHTIQFYFMQTVTNPIDANMCRVKGDDMRKWACNNAFRPQKLRFANSRGMARAVCRKYVPEGIMSHNFTSLSMGSRISCSITGRPVPEGIMSHNFHEPLDGKQNLMFYHRAILPCLKRILARQKYAGNFYTKFRLVKDENGCRIFGAFNTSDWYDFAYLTAQTKRIGGPGGPEEHVTPVPAFLGTDVTVARKKCPFYPCF